MSTNNYLKLSDEDMRLLLDSTSDELFLSNMQGDILYVNKQACISLGYSLEEFTQLNIRDIKSDRYSLKVDRNRQMLQESGELVFESEHKCKSGEIVPVELKSRIVEINGEKVVLSVSRNTEDRKRLERKLLSVVIQTEEKERERFSKDMHDGLGPLLSAIKLYVNELDSDEMDPGERKAFVKHINELIDDAVVSTRTISNNLMPRVIHEYGISKAVTSFCNKINQTNQLKINYVEEGIPLDLDPNIQLILFRVISELINNTLKHAQATEVAIFLRMDSKHIKLDFSDNGVGFDVSGVLQDKNTGIGLKSIMSRISSIKGRMELFSEKGKGFRIEIEIDT
jgi:PAS domain S-box-containing protein